MAGVVRAINGWAECLKKQREIDPRTEALQRLRQQLRYPERQALAGFFGSAPPSATLPVNANIPPSQLLTRKGARPGPPGVGRHAVDASPAERVVDMAPAAGERCPHGDTRVEDQGMAGRAGLESCPVQAARVLSRLPKPYCPRGRRTFQPRAPAVRPKRL